VVLCCDGNGCGLLRLVKVGFVVVSLLDCDDDYSVEEWRDKADVVHVCTQLDEIKTHALVSLQISSRRYGRLHNRLYTMRVV